MSTYLGQLRTQVIDRIGSATAGARAREPTSAMTIFDTLTEDPFIEGPQAVQEYWCAKVQSAGAKYTVTKVTGAVWSALSTKHNEMMNKLVSGNYLWWVMDDTTEGMRTVLLSVAKTLGPLMRTWIQRVRPGPPGSLWSTPEAQMVLRTLVLESWRDSLTTSSWMYQTVASPADREATATRMSAWTRGLMIHAKQQFVKFSKETIKRVLQDRAGLERDTIVEEFESIKDDDVRAAELLKKQFRIGRWGQGANLQKYDADTFEFETEQRKRMGIVDPPVDPIYLDQQQPQQQDYGFALGTAGPEDGYDVEQGAEGDDY